MKRIFYPAVFSVIVVGGLFVGMFKGKEVKHKWISKMKNRQEEKSGMPLPVELNEILLDDFEMATYHS